MRSRKIRGHKRRWNDIEKWINNHKDLNLDYLKDYKRDYAKIRVHPWSGLALTNSTIPEPKRETRKRTTSGLIEIYDSWKITLDKLGEPYYLKIWLFDQRFSNSQVVCAIGEYIDFYENTFHKPDFSIKLFPENFGQLEKQISEFEWEYRLDEDHFDNSEPGSPDLYASIADYEEDKRYYAKMLKKPHRTTKFKGPIGEATESYSFKKGNVWLGQKKRHHNNVYTK